MYLTEKVTNYKNTANFIKECPFGHSFFIGLIFIIKKAASIYLLSKINYLVGKKLWQKTEKSCCTFIAVC